MCVGEIRALDDGWMVLSARYDIFIDAWFVRAAGRAGDFASVSAARAGTSTRRWAL